uniref:Major facilitator superfamily (MFS) profile domain-containing protein n=1 Tax=Acrobeloides nanus TaxID=290746 RepID=A0A914DU63_9BILA
MSSNSLHSNNQVVDVDEKNGEIELNERTPLLISGSLPSLFHSQNLVPSNVDFCGETQSNHQYANADNLPSTSHSIAGLNAPHLANCARIHKKKLRKRVHSEADVPKMRPLIASPFMPTFGTQSSVDKSEGRRRVSTSGSGPPPQVGGRYGTLLLKSSAPAPVESHVEEEDEEDEEEKASLTRSTSTTVSSEESSITRFSDLTKKQWATVGMLAIANLCSTVAFSCIAPFYPAEAKLKDMNPSQIGIIFGVFELVMFVTAPFLGKHMVFFGSKRMFSIGVFITGVTAILFGFLNLLPAGPIFFWASLVVRCAEALGDAAFVTSSFAISAKCFPGRIATIVGIMETFAGLGYTAGPMIGAVLYEAGGFQLPFLVLGALLVLATVLSYFLIEDFEDEPSDDTKGMTGMLKIPAIWIMVFAVVICAISLSFFDPTLADHLSPFNLSTTMVGFMFLLCGGIYTATAPLWGLLIDRWHCCNALMVFGSATTIVSMLLVGPSPLLPINKDLIVIGIALSVLGVAAGALYIPTFQNCLDAVKLYGYDDSFQTYGCVSGVFQSAFAFGAFMGPTLGGACVQWIGFGWTTTFIAGINCIFILTLFLYIGGKSYSKKRALRRKDHQPLNDATRVNA